MIYRFVGAGGNADVSSSTATDETCNWESRMGHAQNGSKSMKGSCEDLGQAELVEKCLR